MDSALVRMDTQVGSSTSQVCLFQLHFTLADKPLQAKKPFPIIPVEIIGQMLRHLSNDKETLIKCMRVSPAFNYAAAPLVYRNVKLDKRNTQSFFASPWNSYKKQDTRKTLSKAYMLSTLVRSFECDINDLADCEISARSRYSDLLAVRTPIWRVYVDTPKRVRVGKTPYTRIDRAPQRVYPTKIVCHGPGINDSKCLLRHLYPSLKSLVIVGEIWRTARQFSHPFSMLSAQKVERLTLIHWLDWSTPHPLQLRYDPLAFDAVSDIQPNTPKAWAEFQKDILKAAQLSNFPTEILIVNMESKAVLELRSPDLAKAATEATQEAYVNSIPDFVGKDGKKTIEQAQKVRIKFVSMRTYLDEYDWKGELTEGQVKPWMEIKLDAEGREIRTKGEGFVRPKSGWGVY
jgi:hypothetical protein